MSGCIVSAVWRLGVILVMMFPLIKHSTNVARSKPHNGRSGDDNA
jgi:hypothetical protein